jgi:hypothetical protein
VSLQTTLCPSVGKLPTFDTAWFAGTTRDGATPLTAETMIQSVARFVIARSAATKQSILSFRGTMDCFAPLAMTSPQDDASGLEQHL